jgi:hypothetical protein
MATVYLDDDNVRALLQTQEAVFTAALVRVRGCREWGVKAFAVPHPDPASDRSGPDSNLGPGAAYLLRKRMARDRAGRARQDVQAAAADLHQTLSAAAVASHLYVPQDPQLSGRRGDMVMNAAYLVEESDAAVFTDAVARWQSPHIDLELTGPWAPYSFAALEES